MFKNKIPGQYFKKKNTHTQLGSFIILTISEKGNALFQILVLTLSLTQ